MRPTVRKTSAVFLAVVVALSAIAMGAGAALAASDGLEITDGPVDPADEEAESPWIEVDITKSDHDVAAHGTGDAGLLTYTDSDGQSVEADADVTGNNTVSYLPSHMGTSEFAEFPRNGDTSAINASHWTTSGATVSDGELGAADTLDFSASLADGGTASATYSDFTLDTDEQIRTFVVVGSVNTLASGATAQIELVDANGNTVAYDVDASQNTSDAGVFAAATGDSFVSQQEIGDLTGGSNIDTVEEVRISAADGDVDLSIAAVDLDGYSTYTFGDTYPDDDDTNDAEELTEPAGKVNVTGLDTIDSAFDDAVFDTIEFTAEFHATQLDDSDMLYESELAEGYPGYDIFGTTTYRFTLPDTHIFSYADPVMESEVAQPDNIYETVQVSTSASDGNLADDVGDYSWVASEQAYAEQGDTVTLASGTAMMTPGEPVAVQFEALYTEDIQEAITTVESNDGGGGGGIFGSGGGGILGTIFGPIGGAFAAVMGWVGLKRRGN